jgi:hypothetical protein
MNVEYVALAVAIVSGIMVPVAITAVFPWVLSINSKVAVIVEKLTALAERLEDDSEEHEQIRGTVQEHERRLDDHEHRITAVEARDGQAQ